MIVKSVRNPGVPKIMNFCTYFFSFSRHYFGKDDIVPST